MARALSDELRELLRNAPTVEGLIARDLLTAQGEYRSYLLQLAARIRTLPIETERGNPNIPSSSIGRILWENNSSPVNEHPAETPDFAGRRPASERTMQSFYPGDLVQWPSSRWDRGAWCVVSLYEIAREERGMPEERYRIVPTGGSSRDEHIVGRSKLNRWTKVERSFEPGDHVIYVPGRTRRDAEDGNMRRVFDEQWVGEVQSNYMSDHAPGDIIVKFAARLPLNVADDWNAVRWREDFRPANPEEVRRMREPMETATQVAEWQQAMRDAIMGRPPHTPERIRRADEVLGVDLASGPDRTVVSVHQQVADAQGISRSVLDELLASGHTYLNRSAAMSSLDEAVLTTLTTLAERAERMKPVAPPPTPTVIGGKRRLKL